MPHMLVADAKDREQLAVDAREAWEHVCSTTAVEGLHTTTLFEVVVWLLASLLALPFSCCKRAQHARRLGTRAVFVAGTESADGKASMCIRNARVPELLVTTAHASSLREMWQDASTRFAAQPCMHVRPVLRNIKQSEKYTKDDGTPGTREDSKVVLADRFTTRTFAEVDALVRPTGCGLHQLLLDGAVAPAPAAGRTTRAAAAAAVTAAATAASAPRHIALYADTKADWTVTAVAAFSMNITVVTAYATLGAEALGFSLDVTEVSVVVTDEALLKPLLRVLGGLSFKDGETDVATSAARVHTVVYLPGPCSTGPPAELAAEYAARPAAQGGPVRLLSLAQVQQLGREHPEAASAPEAVPAASSRAMIQFTSGTTGMPKGVDLSHRNLLASVAGIGGSVPHLSPSDVFIAYLPAAHIFELVAELALLANGCSIGYSSPGTLTDSGRSIPHPDAAAGVPVVRGDAPLLRPTLMAGVPTMFERVRAAVQGSVAKKGGFAQWLFNAAFAARAAARRAGLPTPLWNWLVFDRVRRAALGGRLRLMLSGGGPLEPATEEFMSVVFVSSIAQGYGLTETGGAGSVNWIDDVAPGRVGPPVLSTDLKLVDWEEGGYTHLDEPNPRGEVFISGANVTAGYYRSPDRTAEAFLPDAAGRVWFASGDIGELGPGGILKIIDRKKDLFKLSHGEYIAPARIEGALLGASKYIENCMVYAQSTKDYTLLVVLLNMAALRHSHSRLAEGGIEAAAASAEVLELVRADVERVAKARRLSRVETPRKILLSPVEWSAAAGLLTETLKVKRHAMAKHFRAQLDALYAS